MRAPADRVERAWFIIGTGPETRQARSTNLPRVPQGDPLERIRAGILRRPGLAIFALLAVTAVATLIGMQVEFRTSRNELGPPNDPDQRRMDELLEDYAGGAAVIVCLESLDDSSDPSALREFAGELAAALRDVPHVAQVFHKVDVDWFASRGLHLTPGPEFERLAAAFDMSTGEIGSFVGIAGFTDLNRTLRARILEGRRAGTAPAATNGHGTAALAGVLTAERDFLSDPDAFLVWTISSAS